MVINQTKYVNGFGIYRDSSWLLEIAHKVKDLIESTNPNFSQINQSHLVRRIDCNTNITEIRRDYECDRLVRLSQVLIDSDDRGLVDRITGIFLAELEIPGIIFGRREAA